MAAQLGDGLVLKIGDAASPEVFTALVGLRPTSFTINEEPIDITNKDSTNDWREQMRGGVRSMSLSGGGVFLDSAVDETVRTNVFDNSQTIRNWQVIVPDFGTFQVAAIVTEYGFEGDNQSEVDFSVSLESAGAVTFEAAA